MVDEKTQQWIKKCESLKLFPYLDSTGHNSIGWGRNLDNGIRVSEAELMFQNDLKQTVDGLEQQSWYINQPQNVKNALINMNFNLGIRKLLEFTGMIRALKANNYTLAANESLASLWAKQVGQRSKDIALMIRQA